MEMTDEIKAEKAKESRKKWDNEHLGTLSTRMDRVDIERFRQICAERGTTPYLVLKNFVNDYIVTGGDPAQMIMAQKNERRNERILKKREKSE